MNDPFKFLNDWNQERSDKLAEIGINPGDFVHLHRWYGDVWTQVESVYDNDPKYRSVTHYDRDTRTGTSMTHFPNITKVHRKGDPWDFREVRTVYTPDGRHGDGRPPTPLPDEFRYQGTFTIEPWLWNYCGRNVDPKDGKQLQDWLDLHGLQGTGIAWNEVHNVIETLRTKRIKGWYPICRPIAEQKFDLTIQVRESKLGTC